MVNFTRVSTLSIHNNTLFNVQKAMSEVTKLQRQISSEKAVESFTELGRLGKVERTIDFEDKISTNQSYINQNKIASSRLRQVDLAVGVISEVASKMRDALTLRRSPSGKVMEFEKISRSNLAIIEENLNTNFEGRFLFSGSKTTTRPVENLVSKSNIIQDQATDNYYHGDDIVMSTKAGETLKVDYGIKANDPAFKNLIGALHTAIGADKQDDQVLLEQAFQLINNSINEIAQLRAKTTNDIAIIEKASDNQLATNQYLNEILGKDLKTDLPEATLKLASNEAILRASYMAFARVSRLNLTEYL